MSDPITLDLFPDGVTIANPGLAGHGVYAIVGGGTVATAWADENEATRTLNSTDGYTSAVVSVDSMPTASSIVSVNIWANVYAPAANASIYGMLRIDGSPYYSESLENYYGWKLWEWTINPKTGKPFTSEDVNSDTFLVGTRIYAIGETKAYTYDLRCRVIYYSESVGLKIARDVGGRWARFRRHLQPTIQIHGMLALAKYQPGDIVQVQSSAQPAHDGRGWGENKWQRGTLMVLSVRVDLTTGKATLDCIDMRRIATRAWDTMRSDEEPTNEEPGIARLSPGAGFSFARGSKAWIESPVSESDGIARIIEIQGGQRKIGFKGTRYERSIIGTPLYNSFVSGLTGWTPENEGINGSDVSAEDSGDLLFDPDVSAYCMQFLAGDPPTGYLLVTGPPSAEFVAGNNVVFWCDRLNQTGNILYYRIRRSSDLWYWNDGTQTWQAAAANNVMPSHDALDLNQRYVSKSFPVGGSDATFTPIIIQAAGGAASRIDRVFRVQFEYDYPTSGVVSDATATTRDADIYILENHVGHRTFDTTRGTGFATVIPEWYSWNVPAGGVRVIVEAYFDANNWMRVAYEEAYSGWVFRVKAAGTEYTAFKAQTVMRDVAVNIRWRWISSEIELGLAARTIDIFVNGVKGLAAVPAAACAMTDEAYVYIGHNNAMANHLDGYIRDYDISPFCLADSELLGTPA